MEPEMTPEKFMYLVVFSICVALLLVAAGGEVWDRVGPKLKNLKERFDSKVSDLLDL